MKAQPFSRYFFESYFFQVYLDPTALAYHKVVLAGRTSLEVLSVEIRNRSLEDLCPLQFVAKSLARLTIGMVVIPLACVGIIVNVALVVTGKDLKERVTAIFLDARNGGALAIVPGTVAFLAYKFSLFTMTSPLTALVATTVVVTALILQIAISNNVPHYFRYTTGEILKYSLGIVDPNFRPLKLHKRFEEEALAKEIVSLYQEYRVLLSAYDKFACLSHSRVEDVSIHELRELPGNHQLLSALLERKYVRADLLWHLVFWMLGMKKCPSWDKIIQEAASQKLPETPTVFQQFTNLSFPDDLSHWKELVEIATYAPDREVLRMFFGLPEGFSPAQLQEAVEPLKKRFTDNSDFLGLIEAVRSSLGKV